MRKLYTFALSVIMVLAIQNVSAQVTLLELAPDPTGNTSTFRAPNGTATHTYFRGSTIIRPSELTNIPSGTGITNFGFELAQGATSAVTGNMKIYLMNTNSVTYSNGTLWADIIDSMTLVYDGPVTIPDTGQASPLYYEMALTSPFNFTGGGIYVAYDWSSTGPFATGPASYESNTLLPGGVTMASSTTAPPTNLGTSSGFRPVFRLTYPNPFTNDIGIRGIYSLSQIPLADGPATIEAHVQNSGSSAQTNIEVYLNITGANTFTDTVTINTLAPGEDTIITFDPFNPTVYGVSNIEVSVGADQNAINDDMNHYFEVTCNQFSYADTSAITSAIGFNFGSGLLVSQFTLPAGVTDSILAAEIFISTNAGNTNEYVYAVVLDSASNVVATSDSLLITGANLGTTHSFFFPNKPTFSGGTTGYDFYVGLAQTATTDTVGYFPLGIQTNNPVPPNTFYTAPLSGGLDGVYTSLGIWDITAVMASATTATPGAITASNTTICKPEQGVTFTVPAVPNATSYIWSLPSGVTITSGNNTNSITTFFGSSSVSGNVTVQAVGQCGTSLASAPLAVTVAPEPSADFNFTVSGGTVTLADLSTNATGWSWDFDDGQTSTQQNPTVTYTANGSYDICLTASNGACTDVLCQAVTITGLNITELTPYNWNIYPVPVKDNMIVEISQALKGATINIYNALGQQVLSQSVSGGKTVVNTASLPSGTYTAEIIADDVQMKKIFIVSNK